MATPLRLLILEHNPSDAELMLHTLRHAGYDPIFNRVETEQEYRDHLQPGLEIVLADFSVPGFGALRALEVMQGCPLDIPVIIVSGSLGEERTVQIMQHGAADYVIKDRLERLSYAVTTALKQKSLREANRQAERALRESEELARNVEEAKQQEMEASRQAQEKTVAVNQALMLGSLRQHELTQSAEKLNAQLQEEIAERRRVEEMLKEAGQRKDEFLAVLAHELRNPLAPIRNMLEVMKRADGNGDLIKPALSTMERQLRQMTRLIDDLLDVSRISQGKINLRRERVELASVVRQAVEAARPACESAQQELTATLPSQPVYLNADPVRLTQVFGNLLNNACKFTRPGGCISLAAERQGGEVVITVQDSGIGIPSDMLPKIFELFTQGDQTLERSQGGLGIGLTLVRRLAEMHGGSVQAFSQGVDRGSEFVVRLPVLMAQPQSLTPVAAIGEAAPIIGRRILVVDDNHDAADSLAMLLKLSGNQTHLAFDGAEAVAAAASFRPDVILMDIGMPKLNGYAAARQIREQPWGRGMVLVALTGWGQDEDRKKTAAAGFDGHLVKPVAPTELSKLLAGFAQA